MASICTVDKLKFFLKNDVNVILVGRHGVGKTSMVRQAFIEEELNFRIYSAATMDPWVDFIGVPRAVPNGNSKMIRGCDHEIVAGQTQPFCMVCGQPLFKPESDEMVLQLARPAEWAADEVEAIFFDEFNRSHKKIRNAVMELIQFKSINDRPFKNLRVVWAAINPDDDEDLEYDVETVDPAQLDRFQVKIELPYKCSRQFFQEKYGDEVASTAINWWNGLPDEVRRVVSPRRLEYALDLWQVGGHLEDVLEAASNVSKLRNALKTTPIMSKLTDIFQAYRETEQAKKDTRKPKKSLVDVQKEAMEFLEEENQYACVIGEICAKPQMIAFFVPLMPEEKISDLICNQSQVRNHFLRHYAKHPTVRVVMEQIRDSGTNEKTAREIKRVFQRAKLDQVKKLGDKAKINSNRAASYSAMKKNDKFASTLKAADTGNLDDTWARNKCFERIEDAIPAEMSIADSLTCLTLIDKLVQRSHRKTLLEWKNLIGIINCCVENLANANWDFDEFSGKFDKLSAFIVHCNDFYFDVV